ncbi:PepSY domain-containing protein [Cyanobacterium aponinum UTEX 3222]|uniref:PepSY domain-containing protein n=1 Tax=Cyanobacterium aponinum TaxID=379064 RepID=UPI002B4BA64F|nr:PepSY domain-containing protein [Cyanobacterium aponinum]WRL37586.1 PepSY domain-containing protein [Cyanobacterium aponinum UTEX 3221]WRL41153.1 PepSY domain-containing protein [Cyanobacterium aponinum UTEX 3222]
MALFTNHKQSRRLHRQLAPVMILPVLITLFTGVFFELVVTLDKTDEFLWLLSWHRGDFGILDLSDIYPFLNATGLLMLAISGISLWWQNNCKTRKKKISPPED